MNRTKNGIALALALGTGALAAHARAAETQSHSITLSVADASTAADGRTVVTLASRGDLPGVLTVALARGAGGSVSGEWSLVLSYPTTTSATGDVTVDEPDTNLAQDHDQQGVNALVQRGVLKGTVDGGTVSVNADGSLQSLNDLVLAVSGGTLEFAGVKSGNGLLAATNLSDRSASTGGASIIF